MAAAVDAVAVVVDAVPGIARALEEGIANPGHRAVAGGADIVPVVIDGQIELAIKSGAVVVIIGVVADGCADRGADVEAEDGLGMMEFADILDLIDPEYAVLGIGIGPLQTADVLAQADAAAL